MLWQWINFSALSEGWCGATIQMPSCTVGWPLQQNTDGKWGSFSVTADGVDLWREQRGIWYEVFWYSGVDVSRPACFFFEVNAIQGFIVQGLQRGSSRCFFLQITVTITWKWQGRARTDGHFTYSSSNCVCKFNILPPEVLIALSGHQICNANCSWCRINLSNSNEDRKCWYFYLSSLNCPKPGALNKLHLLT